MSVEVNILTKYKVCARPLTWIGDVLRIAAAALLDPRQLAGWGQARVGGRGRREGHGTLASQAGGQAGQAGGQAGQEGGGQAAQGSHRGQLVD